MTPTAAARAPSSSAPSLRDRLKDPSLLREQLRRQGLRPEYLETTGGHEADYWRQNSGRFTPLIRLKFLPRPGTMAQHLAVRPPPIRRPAE